MDLETIKKTMPDTEQINDLSNFYLLVFYFKDLVISLVLIRFRRCH